MKLNKSKLFMLVSLSIVGAVVGASNLTIPYVFNSGDPALASEINANFSVIEAAVNSIDTTPPEIVHDAPSSTSSDSISIEVTITDDDEIAYYAVQDSNHSENNQTVYVNPGEAEDTFNFTQDTSLLENTVLLVVADVSGNMSKELITVINDTLIVYYSVGDTGPAGGIVFYITDGGLHGLEAAPIDIYVAGDGAHEWGCAGIDVSGARGTAIGTGAQNTLAILAAGCSARYDNDVAADLVDAYSLNGFDDWFLPSKDELNALFAQKDVVGAFASTYYWSSSQASHRNLAYAQEFDFSGSQVEPYKYSTYRVRAVRAF